jgi:hypothetical protein
LAFASNIDRLKNARGEDDVAKTTVVFFGGSAVAFLCAVGGEGSYMSVLESHKKFLKKSLASVVNNCEKRRRY